MGIFKHFDKLVDGNLALDSSEGNLMWHDSKRLKRLKAFIKLLKRREKKISKDEPLFEKIDELKRVYEDLLNFYKTRDSKYAEDIRNILKVEKLDIEAINNRAKEVEPLIEQLEEMHSKISEETVINENQRIKPEKVYDLDKVIKVMKNKGYKIFTEPFKANIVGVRTPSPIDDFNDTLILFWYDENNNLNVKQYRFTTDPGAVWLEGDKYLEVNKKGIAILKENQYIDAYRLGLHHGGRKNIIKSKLYDFLKPITNEGKLLNKDITSLKRCHEALVQTKDVEVYRDDDGDGKLTLNKDKIEKGIFYINIHRGEAIGITKKVDIHSTGCQVFADVKDYEEFIKLIKGKLKSKNNRYTYTLLRDKGVVYDL
ncbi:hypothetical protein ISS04_02910 [Candidatus Woesearchaeota archaeon]|nr:hypothetical protein [Candidatus Woesearchaeota archaeon]